MINFGFKLEDTTDGGTVVWSGGSMIEWWIVDLVKYGNATR